MENKLIYPKKILANTFTLTKLILTLVQEPGDWTWSSQCKPVKHPLPRSTQIK